MPTSERPGAAGDAAKRTVVLVWLGGSSLLAAAICLSWNGSPYWMDAPEYARTVSEGRWVVHPPGYLLFLAIGRLLHGCGFADAHRALQVLTLLLMLAGILATYRLLREVVTPLRSSLLAFTFALSWVPLLINHTGTSCTSDLFTVPLLLWASVRLTDRPTRSAALVFAVAVFVCGAFRLTTLIMMGPLLTAVLVSNRRNRCVWAGCAVSGLMIGLLQLLAIRASGGWEMFSFMAMKLHHANRSHGVSDPNIASPGLFNLGRGLLWFALATTVLWFALLRLRSRQPWSARQRMLVAYGGLATAGPVAVCTLYFCEHPGYLAPALAGFYLCVAVAWDRNGGRRGFVIWPIASVAVSLTLFLGLHYDRAPATRGQAVANALLLQYSADAARHGRYLTLQSWLSLVGDRGAN